MLHPAAHSTLCIIQITCKLLMISSKLPLGWQSPVAYQARCVIGAAVLRSGFGIAWCLPVLKKLGRRNAAYVFRGNPRKAAIRHGAPEMLLPFGLAVGEKCQYCTVAGNCRVWLSVPCDKDRIISRSVCEKRSCSKSAAAVAGCRRARGS